MALRYRCSRRPVGCGSNNRRRSRFRSRGSSRGSGQSLSTKLVVQNRAWNTVIIHRSELQETDRLLHQTLRGKKIGIFEVTVVQGRKFV